MDIDPGLIDDDLDRAIGRLAESFAARSIRYAIIGGVATSLRGRQRTTQDVDVLLDVPQVHLPGLLDDLIERGFTLDQETVVREYVRQHITSFLFGDVRIDWLKPVLPIYARALADASPIPWAGGLSLHVATAEGLILTKMVAFRTRDQLDIETLLMANRDEVDIALIRQEWSAFAASEPERTAWLEANFARIIAGHE